MISKRVFHLHELTAGLTGNESGGNERAHSEGMCECGLESIYKEEVAVPLDNAYLTDILTALKCLTEASDKSVIRRSYGILKSLGGNKYALT